MVQPLTPSRRPHRPCMGRSPRGVVTLANNHLHTGSTPKLTANTVSYSVPALKLQKTERRRIYEFEARLPSVPTFTPYRASSAAQLSPPMPLPMTTTSTSMSPGLLLLAVPLLPAADARQLSEACHRRCLPPAVAAQSCTSCCLCCNGCAWNVRRSRSKHAGGAEPATQPQNMPASTAKVLNALIVRLIDRCNGNECRPGRSGGSARHAPHTTSCLSVIHV